MRFTTLDGREMRDVTFAEFKQYFVEHIFFKFMEHGRKGIDSGAEDLIDTTAYFILEKNPDLKERYSGLMDAEDYREVKNHATRLLVESFITQGTAGMYGAIMGINMIVGDAIRKTPAKTQSK